MSLHISARLSAEDPSQSRITPAWVTGLIVACAVLASQSHANEIYGTPSLLLPNTATNDPVNFTTERVVADGYALTTWYRDAAGAQVRKESGVVLSTAPASFDWGPADSNASVYGNAGAFDARAKFSTSNTGDPSDPNKYAYGQAQVWNWYVLSGTPGTKVKLAADILVQGRAFADDEDGTNDGNAGAIFSASLGFLSNPSDLEQDYVTALVGGVNWTAGFSLFNTVDVDVRWDKGTAIREVNYIIRSQSFEVTVGEPFRLSLLTGTQGFAGPGGWGEAWADFIDPRLVTSSDFLGIDGLSPTGFSVVLDEGEYAPLGAEDIARIPEPGTLALLGLGLAGLAATRRRKQ